MEKVSIVYWSQTGNTEAMANMLASGVEEAGASAQVIEVSDASASDLLSQAGFALGCPAMGAEELEDSVFEPFISEIESGLSGNTTGATESGCVYGRKEWKKPELL